MTLMLLTAMVDRLMVPTTWFLRYLNATLGHLYQPFNIRVFHLMLVAVFLVVFFFLVPAAVFNALEPDWNYLDSIYYCFISLTTIGLGDYIPGDSPSQPLRPIYKIVTTGSFHFDSSYNALIFLTETRNNLQLLSLNETCVCFNCLIGFFCSLFADRADIYGVDADRVLRDPATEHRLGVSAEIGRVHRHQRLDVRHGKVTHPGRSHLLRRRNDSVFAGIEHRLCRTFRHLRSIIFLFKINKSC